jgi:hypothetical protein
MSRFGLVEEIKDVGSFKKLLSSDLSKNMKKGRYLKPYETSVKFVQNTREIFKGQFGN